MELAPSHHMRSESEFDAATVGSVGDGTTGGRGAGAGAGGGGGGLTVDSLLKPLAKDARTQRVKSSLKGVCAPGAGTKAAPAPVVEQRIIRQAAYETNRKDLGRVRTLLPPSLPLFLSLSLSVATSSSLFFFPAPSLPPLSPSLRLPIHRPRPSPHSSLRLTPPRSPFQENGARQFA